ncbi:uncharacterized protein EDB91DRAFT_1340174 [Suillus paluster]|uniref:uncharacterized protein n=1 Tax=Suillus paluster TaxID=48578 RepID=UPI001B87A0F7|nr:uncharacterized protein EDB91DRAFT_1340174 [Suillus paluster]KAG1723719.1 hypothetical protein EDB91DRAFT_1340174 [Suillus paluster]
MIIPREYLRAFISWLRLILKTTASRLYTSLSSVLLRLIRCCQLAGSGQERACREGILALSSQPAEQDRLPASVTLAVPLSSIPEPSIYITSPQSPVESSINITLLQPPVSGQSLDITLTPIIPFEIRRFDILWNVKIKDEPEYKVFEIEKGPLACSEELAPVAGWEPLTHPNGALFFYHPYQRVFTDANVRDPATAVRMGKAAEKVYQEAWNADVILQPSIELALEITKKNGHIQIGYYFVDHDRRVIFWFEAHKSDDLMCRVRGVERKSHIRYAVESQYWRHVELFPNKRSLPENVVMLLKEIVVHAQAENIVVGTSQANFASDQVERILGLMDPLTSSINREHEHSVHIVARCMSRICLARFLCFCGQPGARLHAYQFLYGYSNTCSMFFRAINVLMFGSPRIYSRNFQRITVDKVLLTGQARNLVDRLKSEWNIYSIFSTVMVAVDISFLSVSSVQTQTVVIILTYMSTLCAMGSLASTLVFAKQLTFDWRYPDSDKCPTSFISGTSPVNAIMLSLPFSLLTWGMIYFAAALSTLIFRTTSPTTFPVVFLIWMLMVYLAAFIPLYYLFQCLKSWIRRLRILFPRW